MYLETDNMSREYYVAGDAHKDFVTVTVLDPKGKMIEQFEVPAKPSGMEDIIKKMNKKKFCYMAETSSYSIDLHNYLVSRGVDAILVDPKNLKLITDSHKKTDEHDSEILAKFLRLYRRGEIELSVSYIVQDVDQEIRDICRQRERYGKLKGQTVQRIKAHMRRNSEYIEEEVLDNFETESNRDKIRNMFGDDLALGNHLDDYTYYLGKCLKLDEQMSRFYKKSKNQAHQKITLENEASVLKAQRFMEGVSLLESIPGIGLTTAIQLQSMIVDIDRFESSDKMRSFFGLAPNVRNSGGKTNHGHITKCGDPMMRSILSRVVNVCRRMKIPDITEFYDTHVQSMGKMKARIACANKILDRIFSVLKRGTPFKF